MENIDPVFFIGPLVVIAFSFGLAYYWHVRRRLTVWVLLFSAVAYFGAIGAKALIQALTYGPLDAASGGSPWILGPYFGLQTVFLEVGGAYLVARYAAARGFIRANDAEGYGINLALWENGVLLGGLILVEYVAYYSVLSGTGSGAQQLYTALTQSAPSLFDPTAGALRLVGFQILERITSLLVHFSFGYLCVLAAVFRRRVLLVAALPMGLVDFLVPFESSFGLSAFEGLIFAIGLASVAVAVTLTRGQLRAASIDFTPPAPEPGSANLRSLVISDFRRALSFGKVYVIIGMALPLLLGVELSAAGSAAAAASSGAGGSVLGEVYPLLLPIFVELGSSGGLMIFASDKERGVYEYMLAYGVDVSSIFWSIVAATVALATIVLAVSLVLTLTLVAVTSSGALTLVFGELIVFYTIPLSYAATMFMCMAGMIWAQLTARRPGVNSPVGMAPLLGIAPVLVVLLLAVGPGSAHLISVVGGGSLLMIGAVVLMAYVANKRMQRERFLSNA